MPANTAATAVKTLSASFEGISGAVALSLIAFSVVFLVLAGLTLLIFAMRIVTRAAGAVSSAPSAAAPKAAAPAPKTAASAPAAAVCAAEDDELVAVITAAIAAEMGGMVAVKSIVPVGGHYIASGTDGWIACARMEGMQGDLCSSWR
ncbi:MAG: OadG family transporter subunit [Pyramidobacter sp.]|nr:OadG family transporter subunit [Pyramidobacter sp.]